jgi:hypothetical protein
MRFGGWRGSRLHRAPLAVRVLAGLRGAGAVAVVLLGLLVVGAAAIAIQSVFGDEHEPVPIVAAHRPTGLSGWLLSATPGGAVEARNLATGERRTLSAGADQRGSGGPPLVSPDFRKVATWRWVSGTTETIAVAINDMQGNTLKTFEWDGVDAMRYPLGWLGNARLMVMYYPQPQPGESEEEMTERFENETTLVAVDIDSGDETTLMRGPVGYAKSAPDGRTVAVMTYPNYMKEWPGSSLGVYPVEDGRFGEPVATLEHRVAGSTDAVWAPDGSRLYLTRITDDAVKPLDQNQMQPSAPPYERGYESSDIVSIDREGRIEHIADVPEDTTPLLMSVSPDQRYLAFVKAEQVWYADAQTQTVDIQLLDTTSGVIEPFATDQAMTGWSGFEGVWSPDSTTMLAASGASAYFGDASVSPWAGGPEMTALRALRPGEAVQEIEQSFAWAGSLVAWLPEDALPSEDAAFYLDGPSFTGMELVGKDGTERVIDADRSVSPDGAYLLLAEGDPPAPVIYHPATADGRRWRSAAADISWMPDSAGVIGVAGLRPGVARPSRLMVFAAEWEGYGSQGSDLRSFDPADIGDREHLRYARPLISPDGTLTSYFVINEEVRLTELWIAGAGREMKKVAQWQAPENALLEVPVVAAWASRDTLLFVEPDEWSGGLPQTARFKRVTVGAQSVVEPLDDIVGRGDDQGIVISELAISPDSHELAFRVSHFGKEDAEQDRNDTIHVASTSDISQELQLARGRLGYGLTWIDDGEWLAAGLRGQIAVMAANGSDVEYVSDEGGDARYPLHVGNGEIWFSYDDGGGSRTMRVVVE